MKKLGNLYHFRDLNLKMYMLDINTGRPGNRADLIKYKKILDHGVKVAESNASTTLSKIYYHQAKILYYIAAGSHRKAIRHAKAIILRLGNNIQLRDSHFSIYTRAHINITILWLYEKQYTQALTYNKKLLTLLFSMQKNNNYVQNMIQYYSIELITLMLRRNFSDGSHLMNEVNKFIATHKKNISYDSLYYFHYYFAYIYYGLFDLKNAAKYLNTLLNDHDKKIHKDLYHIARLFNLILIYEKEDLELLAYETISTQRLFKKKKSLNEVEAMVFRFFNAYIKHPTNKIELLNKLKKELIKISGEHYANNIFRLFDFNAWVNTMLHHNQVSKN